MAGFLSKATQKEWLRLIVLVGAEAAAAPNALRRQGPEDASAGARGVCRVRVAALFRCVCRAALLSTPRTAPTPVCPAVIRFESIIHEFDPWCGAPTAPSPCSA